MKKLLRLFFLVATVAFAPAIAVNQSLIQYVAEHGNADAVATLVAEENGYEAMLGDDKLNFLKTNKLFKRLLDCLLEDITEFNEFLALLHQTKIKKKFLNFTLECAEQSTREEFIIPALLTLAQTPGLTIKKQHKILNIAVTWANQSTRERVIIPALLTLAQTPGLSINQQHSILETAGWWAELLTFINHIIPALIVLAQTSGATDQQKDEILETIGQWMALRRNHVSTAPPLPQTQQPPSQTRAQIINACLPLNLPTEELTSSLDRATHMADQGWRRCDGYLWQ